MSLIDALKLELSIATNDQDDDLAALIDVARASFADKTYRNIGSIAAGDPLTTVVRPVYDGIVRIPDARSIVKVETSPRRLGATWTEIASTAYDAVPWFVEDSYVWLTLDGVSSGVARVTGRFGLSPLPQPIATAIVTLAAHRFRGRGAGAAGEYGFPDGTGAEQTFAFLPPAYMSAVKDYRVPQAALQAVGL